MTVLDQSLGTLACSISGATEVFHEYRLDFCCGGKHTLREAAAAKGLPAEQIEARLLALQNLPAPTADWRGAGNPALIAYILERFHAQHRKQLPELIRLARRVEHVHGGNPDCPVGLADHLETMRQELESHMLKEEQVLFPMLTRMGANTVGGPIAMMRFEHEQHGNALAQLEALTHNFTLPEGACNTWTALYLGLATLRHDLMEHIHLENNFLFAGMAEVPAVAADCACNAGTGICA